MTLINSKTEIQLVVVTGLFQPWYRLRIRKMGVCDEKPLATLQTSTYRHHNTQSLSVLYTTSSGGAGLKSGAYTLLRLHLKYAHGQDTVCFFPSVFCFLRKPFYLYVAPFPCFMSHKTPYNLMQTLDLPNDSGFGRFFLCFVLCE